MASVISVSSPFGTALSASISSASVSTTARAARLGLATCALALPELEPFTPSTASLARFAGASDIALRVDRRQPFQRKVGSRHATPTALAFPVSRACKHAATGEAGTAAGAWCHIAELVVRTSRHTYPQRQCVRSLTPHTTGSFISMCVPPPFQHVATLPLALTATSRRVRPIRTLGGDTGRLPLYGPPASRPTGHTVTRGSWPRPGAAARRPGRLRGAHVLRSRRPPPRRGSVRAPAPRAAAP